MLALKLMVSVLRRLLMNKSVRKLLRKCIDRRKLSNEPSKNKLKKLNACKMPSLSKNDKFVNARSNRDLSKRESKKNVLNKLVKLNSNV